MAMLKFLVLALGLDLGVAKGDLPVDRTNTANTFDGIGGLSGGGATTVLLPQYKEPARSQILDYLFKPNFGASLQILKVEIGGDSQSTDGTESSHMHNADTVDLHTGYEWWLMQEAKKRNPNIKLYGLAWAFPGWVGNFSGSPFDFPHLTAKYLVEWVSGAKKEYNLDIDYLGIWNERSSDSTFVQVLRKALNDAGISGTKIVVKDGGSDICDDLAKDKAYKDAVDIIGLHYPTDFKDYSVCHSLGKPIWASEESSSYDDLNGAACWGRIINAHYVINQMTSSIMWNLVGAYYHGTNWYASSMLTSVEPWSGHYEVNPVIWATAHVTQFTSIGWKYLANGTGSGELPQGGYYVTWVDPNSADFTMNVVKISRDHASCTRPKLPEFSVEAEKVIFKLASSMKAPDTLEVWHSNFETYDKKPPLFQHSTVKVIDGSFTLNVMVGDMYTITTVKTGSKGSFGTPPASSPSFPLPYSEDFQSVSESQDAKWLADQIGAFEVHPSSDGKKSLRQMVPQLPIGWSDHGSNGPMTLIGMREWQDISVSIDFKLPKLDQVMGTTNAACVAARIDQMWKNGIVVCIDESGAWNLTNAGPPLQGQTTAPPVLVDSGKVQPIHTEQWHTLSLTVQRPATPSQKTDVADGALDGKSLFSAVEVRNMDTGFAGFGANGWFPVEYRKLSISKAQRGWEPPSGCASAKVGSILSARPCARNGLTSADQEWNLLPSFQLQHAPTGLCASAPQQGHVTLQSCSSTDKAQLFVNDYTRIRNKESSMTVASVNQALEGDVNGSVHVGEKGNGDGVWKTWAYFPNTRQLRNQYTANLLYGYPMCLSACAPSVAASVILM